MELGLAGFLSGAGTAAKESLAEGQKAMTTAMLEQSRQDMENLRQERNLAAADKRGERDIASRENLSAKEITSRENLSGKEIASREGLSEKETASREKIAGDSNKVHKEIGDASNAMHLKVAELQRQLQEKQFDKSFTEAKIRALSTTTTELGNSITRLSVVVSNPLADKDSDAYKSAVIQLEAATRLHNLYAKKVGTEIGIEEQEIGAAIKPPALQPFKSPTAARTEAPRASAPRTPGMVQVPAPSPEIQSQMEAAEELRRRGSTR